MVRKLALTAIIWMVLASSSAWAPAVAEGCQSWKLDGAAERIERLRKGTAKLQFVLPDGSEPNNALQVDIELKKHDFLFGVHEPILGTVRTSAF